MSFCLKSDAGSIWNQIWKHFASKSDAGSIWKQIWNHFGAILEPIFMGKSFSINVIAVLVMLMFWGFLWGIPGLIMAIPITVFFKIILEQFSGTEVIVSLLSGNDIKTP